MVSRSIQWRKSTVPGLMKRHVVLETQPMSLCDVTVARLGHFRYTWYVFHRQWTLSHRYGENTSHALQFSGLICLLRKRLFPARGSNVTYFHNHRCAALQSRTGVYTLDVYPLPLLWRHNWNVLTLLKWYAFRLTIDIVLFITSFIKRIIALTIINATTNTAASGVRWYM